MCTQCGSGPSAAPSLYSVLFLILILPRHGLQGDQAEEGGQEERQARGDIHGKLQPPAPAATDGLQAEVV